MLLVIRNKKNSYNDFRKEEFALRDTTSKEHKKGTTDTSKKYTSETKKSGDTTDSSEDSDEDSDERKKQERVKKAKVDEKKKPQSQTKIQQSVPPKVTKPQIKASFSKISSEPLAPALYAGHIYFDDDGTPIPAATYNKMGSQSPAISTPSSNTNYDYNISKNKRGKQNQRNKKSENRLETWNTEEGDATESKTQQPQQPVTEWRDYKTFALVKGTPLKGSWIAFKELYLSVELRRPVITDYFVEGVVVDIDEKNKLISITFIDPQSGQYTNETRELEITALQDARLIQLSVSDEINKQSTSQTTASSGEITDLLSTLESKKKGTRKSKANT